MDNQEMAFHLNIRNNADSNIVYGILADYYEDINGDKQIIEYLRLMSLFLEAQQQEIHHYVNKIWELIKDNNKLMILGFLTEEPLPTIDFMRIPIKDRYKLFYGVVRARRRDIVRGIMDIVHLTQINDLEIDWFEKYTLIKRYIVLTPIWNQNYGT